MDTITDARPRTAEEARARCDEQGQNAWLRVELGLVRRGQQEVRAHGTSKHLGYIGNGFPADLIVERNRGHWMRVCWRPREDSPQTVNVERQWLSGWWMGWGLPLLNDGATIEWDPPRE